MPWATSTRFRQTVVGSHLAVSRVRLLTTVQYGLDPVGQVLPLLAGDVKMSATADIKATATITVPGDYWDAVQPYGGEVFIERGVSFGDGTAEYVPLGYFRIDKATQDQQPYGPIVLDLSDRTAQLQQVRAATPWQVPAATTHRAVVAALVNGSPTGVGTYGLYGPAAPAMVVDWTAAGYNPDTTTVGNDVVIDNYAYDFLAKLVGANGAILRFAPTGELAVVATEPAPDAPASRLIVEGVTGTLIKTSRSVSRDGVANIVRATGSDPAFMTGYQFAYIVAPSKLAWNGPFGPSIRYFASPLLTTADQAAGAAGTTLGHQTGLPTTSSLYTVPDPSVQTLDKVNALVGGAQETHIVNELSIPLLVATATPLTIATRTTNPVGVVDVTVPSVPALPDPTDPSGGGTTDPGGGGTDPGGPVGPADPLDGTQTATARAWGAVIDGDEFNYTGRPNSKWGLYDGVGHDGNGRRTPSAFSVHDGMMTCHGDSNGNTGGTAFQRGSMGYRIEVRMRVYFTANDGGDRYHPVLILWPDSDQWPQGAEYDFVEFDEGDSNAEGFMHLPNHQPYRQDQFSIPGDPTQWHNYACEWDPGRQTLTQWTDGTQRYRGTGRVAQAPGPMHPTIQLDNFGGDPRSANMDIAWVRIYANP